MLPPLLYKSRASQREWHRVAQSELVSDEKAAPAPQSMTSPGTPAKRRHGGAGFALGCGCKDAKSVSSVASWGRKSHHHHHHDKKLQPPPPKEHRKVKSGCHGDDAAGKLVHRSDDGVGVGLDGSVAVVKQSDDPLGDFRQSMLQMIVENGIVAGEDLREMLRRFLALNAPHHHDVILRAFAEIWDDVFAASLYPAAPTSRPRAGRGRKATHPEDASAPPPLGIAIATSMARVTRSLVRAHARTL
ncbi:hypothetical protein GUJ93_ZPchr0136g33674 [Zizania palustris]|uniref:Transcription repressor n=1 Tax=Zizania palustris TaxID=103762 RepID=A0A8J5V302_ZIZPA|nr:hypothetical protein GUJ93_ZPchr0136g33674 [Zizania palustris]